MLHTLDGKGPWRHSIMSGAPKPAARRRGVLAALVAALRRIAAALAPGRARG